MAEHGGPASSPWVFAANRSLTNRVPGDSGTLERVIHGHGRWRDRVSDPAARLRGGYIGGVRGVVRNRLNGRGWTLRALLLTVAFATVVMHHLAGAHQHDSGDHATPHGTAAATPTTHGGHSEPVEQHLPRLPVPAPGAGTVPHEHISTGAVATIVTGPTAGPTLLSTAPGSAHPPGATSAPVHVHHDAADDESSAHSWLHLCLAVLAAAAAALALYLIRELRSTAGHRGGRFQLPVRGRGAPPPPVPLRLAQLQVLRI